jgi:hypothetical protein
MMAGRQPLLPWRRVQRAPAPTFRAAAPMILLFLLLLGLQAPRARGSDDDDDSDDCWRPPWDPPASIEADVRLAERVDEMIAGGQADEAVRQLRLALSPTVLEDVGRYWDAPHELLRRGLGRALLKASPAVCPDETACRAAALAQFVAAEKARRREDPLRAFVPLDAIELRPRDKWEPPPSTSAAADLAKKLLGWAGVAEAPPPGHMQGMFELPGRQGEVETFGADEAAPTVREFFRTYAPGATTGFLRPQCAAAVSEVRKTPFLNIVLCNNDRFTKTGSGQT